MGITLTAETTKTKEGESRIIILDSARDLFVEFGLRKTSMDDVAKRSGIGRATLYRRFGDKDELFQAVIVREVQTDLSKIEIKIRSLDNHLEGLIEAFVMAVTSIDSNKLLDRLFVTEPEHTLPFFTTRFSGVMKFATAYLAERIKRGQSMGHIHALDANVTAEMILRLIQSLMLSPTGFIASSDEKSIRTFANHWLRPLLAPK